MRCVRENEPLNSPSWAEILDKTARFERVFVRLTLRWARDRLLFGE